jgi:hypothetical protein
VIGLPSTATIDPTDANDFLPRCTVMCRSICHLAENTVILKVLIGRRCRLSFVQIILVPPGGGSRPRLPRKRKTHADSCGGAIAQRLTLTSFRLGFPGK